MEPVATEWAKAKVACGRDEASELHESAQSAEAELRASCSCALNGADVHGAELDLPHSSSPEVSVILVQNRCYVGDLYSKKSGGK